MTGSKNTPPPVLSPNNILPPLAYHCVFTAVRKKLVRVDKNYYFFTFFLNCVSEIVLIFFNYVGGGKPVRNVRFRKVL